MPTYRKPEVLDEQFSSVKEMSTAVIGKFHEPLAGAGVRIDFLFAFCERDDNGRPLNNALMHGGYPANGLCKIIGNKERALGHGDAQILLDADWWDEQENDEREALLDHEIQHITLVTDRHGNVKKDDLGRPKLKSRKHDFQCGWFKVIAERHGAHSQERIQAARIVEVAGQFFFPQFVATSGRFSNLEVPDKGATVTIKTGDREVSMSHDQFSKAAGKITSALAKK